MTTLITGGAGFIGSRLTMALQTRGEDIVVLDNFNDSYDPALKRANIEAFYADPPVTVIEGDIRDANLVEDIIRKYHIKRIAHLAGMANVRRSVEQAPLYFAVNLMGSLNLLEAARKFGVEQFVQASTSSVYGETARLPFEESDAADRPLAPYPASKRAAEIEGHAHHHLFGLNVTCLRFFNVYGPQGRPDMMPMRVMQAILAGEPIQLFAGGNFKRDWTYIDDIVAGVVAALDKPLGYEIINLGCGNPISMTDFVDIFEELIGKTAIRQNIDAPLSDPPITYCNNSRAQYLLGFSPQVPIQDGLSRTWNWYKTIAKVSQR